MLRSRLAGVLFVLIVLASIDPVLLRNVVSPPEDTSAADRYERFLEEVRRKTRPGDAIALLLPTSRWDDGYAYGFHRAQYVLSGRTVLPVAGPDEAMLDEIVARAPYVALWSVRAQSLDRPVVFDSGDGMLLGRR